MSVHDGPIRDQHLLLLQQQKLLHQMQIKLRQMNEQADQLDQRNHLLRTRIARMQQILHSKTLEQQQHMYVF